MPTGRKWQNALRFSALRRFRGYATVTLVLGLFDRYGFGEIAGLVYVGAFQDRYVIGEQLYRDGVQDGGDEGVDAG
jgi:hypothetical protein